MSHSKKTIDALKQNILEEPVIAFNGAGALARIDWTKIEILAEAWVDGNRSPGVVVARTAVEVRKAVVTEMQAKQRKPNVIASRSRPAAQKRRAEQAEARAAMLEQLVIDLMYATDHVVGNPLLEDVRRTTAISIPTLVGHAGAPHKAKPSWDK